VWLARGLTLLAALALAGAGVARAAPVRVTLITDSVAEVLTQNPVPEQTLAQGFEFQFQSQACRKLASPGCPASNTISPSSALDVVHMLGSQLGPIVVIDVGYNDIAPNYPSGLDEVMAALVAAGVRKVVWVTLEENQGTWAEINQVIRAAPARWPELTVADWAPVAAGQPWFTDDAHLNYDGAVAFASFLRPILLGVCGKACAPPPPRFCGLARTVNGFDPVSAVRGISCGRARGAIRGVERGDAGPWVCSRAVHAGYELDCRTSGAEIQVLERSPVPAVRHGGVVTLANWSFRLRGPALQGLTGRGHWQTLIARPPYCVPDAPRQVLAALPLRRTTSAGGCYAPR
jgi:hypothetical protein